MSDLSYAVSAIIESPVVKATRLGSVEIPVKSEHVTTSESVEQEVCNMFVDILLIVSVDMPSLLDVTICSCDMTDN